MPTATLIQDRSRGREQRISRKGGLLVGERYYRVDTSDDDAALAAVEVAVPIGTAWSVGRPNLKAMDYDPVEGHGAWWDFRVGYSEDTGGGGSIDGTAVNTTAFHELVEATSQQEITADISFNAIKPTTKIIASNQLVVTGYRTGAQYLTATSHWHSIRGKLNSGTVAIPAMLNVSGSNFTAAAKQLLAMTRRVTPVQQNLVRIDYTFGFGPAGTFQYIWIQDDEDGNPYLGYTSDIYDTVAYTPSNLWG